MPGDCDPVLRSAFGKAFEPVRKSVADGRIPGAVFGVLDAKRGRIVEATGLAARVPAPRPMRLDTWFDLASLTKVLFTTPRILALHQAGRIDIDAPLTSVLPDLRQDDLAAWERQVTFRQCLGHLTPFPADAPLFRLGADPAGLRRHILVTPWPSGPATYSDINFILLGLALERLHGKLIRDQAPGSGFAFSAPPEASAATEHCPWRCRVLSGEVHDENCAALAGAGHAGLFGTIEALLDQAGRWLDGDEQGDPVVGAMRQNLSSTRTHGWECAHPGWSGGDCASADTIGHTGFTGTGLWIDFRNRRAWALLTNRIHPDRHADSGIFTLRPAVGDLLNSHLN